MEDNRLKFLSPRSLEPLRFSKEDMEEEAVVAVDGNRVAEEEAVADGNRAEEEAAAEDGNSLRRRTVTLPNGSNDTI